MIHTQTQLPVFKPLWEKKKEHMSNITTDVNIEHVRRD